MRPSEPLSLRGGVAAAIALSVALPFNALGAEPTPDPPEPYLMGTVAAGIDAMPVIAANALQRAGGSPR